MKAISAMTRDVVCITPDDSLQEAQEIMTEWDIRHLPVLSGKQLVGILSDRDILAYASRSECGVMPRVSVSEAMTQAPTTCGLSTSIAEIGKTMLDLKIDCLPIVDDDELVGLVTSSDLIELLVEREQQSLSRTIPFHYKVYQSARPGTAAMRPQI